MTVIGEDVRARMKSHLTQDRIRQERKNAMICQFLFFLCLKKSASVIFRSIVIKSFYDFLKKVLFHTIRIEKKI